jgi:hypothetical protein
MPNKEQETNFLPREKRGRYPKEGDIFYYRHKHLGYGYGRVIKISDNHPINVVIPWSGALVYLYDYFSEELEISPKLDKTKLVLPPLCTFFYDFSSGPFVKMKNVKLEKDDILEVNCYYDLLRKDKQYFDFFTGKEIQRVEPCGNNGTKSILYVDALISEAKGVPIAENDLTRERLQSGTKFKSW